MADSNQNSQIVNNPDSPNEPLPPGDGGGDGHPPAITVTSISPIAGALAGGSDVTIIGTGFQAGAEVFFGTTASVNVQVQTSTQIIATAPAGTQTGTEPVSVVNPDGSHGELTNGFTYFTANPSDAAQVLGVEPANIIEDTDSQITIRGRNLIAANENGLVALRGPARAAISVSGFSSSRDDASGIETLACTVRVVATPPLAAAERMAIQVIASVRPGAQTDGIVESSREMFVVLPKTIPVMLAYTANVDPAKPNMVMVTGRNLEGCSLDLGANALVHSQKSDDEFVAALVSYPNGAPPPQIALQTDSGNEAARFDMSVATPESSKSARLAPIEGNGGGGDLGGDDVPTLTPVPGQQVVGPTAESSTVVNLQGQFLDGFNFDWSGFAFQFFHITFRLRIANFIKVVPFFDGGGEDLNSPVRAKVGQLMPLRGMGVLIALRVEITITLRISIILSWKHGFDFGPWNSDLGFGLGSVVIGFQLDIDIDIEIFFMVALVLPDGSLKVLAVVDIDINFHFEISTDLHSIRFNNFKHKVNKRRIGPLAGNPFACDGRFQLADDNGQTSFTDRFGADLAFYFVRGPGRCCLSWNYDLDLIRFTDDGPETSIQPPFNVDYCLNALDSFNQNVPIVVSDQCPRGSLGFPGVEELTVGDPDKGEDDLRALMRPVDASGAFLPTESELQDVTDLGYHPYFYLADPDNPVCDSTGLFDGVAIATQPGNNTICVQLADVDINITQGPEAPSFWPGAVTGFSILSFLARGLAPALLFECTEPTTSVGLPVKVDQMAAPGTMTVSLTLAYYEGDELKEAKQGTTLLLERNEPFETQRQYVLAARIAANQVQFPQTIKVTAKNPQVGSPLAGLGFSNTREDAQAAKDFFEGELVNDTTSGSSMTFEVTSGMIGKLIPIGPQDRNGARLKITPHNKEEGGDEFVPPGKAVRGSDTTVTIDFDVQPASNSTATVQLARPSLTFVVSNDETFEEYLRVFKEVEKILTDAGTKFSGFAKKFYADLNANGHDSTLLNRNGEQLWKDARELVQGGVKDDRPLYWARLQGIGALRAYAKRRKPPLPPLTGTTLEQAITQFEWPSRGLDSTGAIVFDSTAGSRKVVVTGFDPFQLPSQPDSSNPSGLIALELDKGSVGSSQPPVDIRTAVIPVRYKEFDDGLIEKLLRLSLGTLYMLVTCSENGGLNYYDLERWASRNRVISTDNNKKRPQQIPGDVPPSEEFEESTLPYDAVITSSTNLSGPKGDALFVIDQSYLVAGVSGLRARNRIDKPADQDRDQARPGEFRPEPDGKDDSGFKKVADGPDPEHKSPTKKSSEGSGGSYLSNEIFYRTARQRRTDRPALPSGHFHVPGTETKPKTTGPALITGARKALGLLVDKVAQLRPRITSFRPTSVRPGGFVTIVGENLAGAFAVRVGTDDVLDFTVLSATEIVFNVTDEMNSGFISVDTPFGTALSATQLIIIRRFRFEDFGPQLAARRAELGLSNSAAASQLGVSSSAYRRWERGLDRPSTRFNTAIAAFLGYDPNPSPQELGQLIRDARERDGLTRSQLAERLNLSSSTVKAWETGSVTRPSTRVSGIFENYLAEE